MIPVKWPGLKAGMLPAVGPQPVIVKDKEKIPRDESLSPKKKAPYPEDRGRSTVKKKLADHNREGSRSFSDPSGRRWPPSSSSPTCTSPSSESTDEPDRTQFERSNTVQDLVRTFEDLTGKKASSTSSSRSSSSSGLNKRGSSNNWRRPCNQYGEGIPLYEAMLSELRQAVSQPEQEATEVTPPSVTIQPPDEAHMDQRGILSYQQSPCYPVLMNELEGILEEWDHGTTEEETEPPIKLPRLNRVILTGTALLVPRPFLGPYTQMQLGRRFSTGSLKQSRRTWRPYDKQTAC